MVAKIVNKLLAHNDHRQIGIRQGLFFFDEMSQGSCFFEPRGARIYNKLIEFLRDEYKLRNYREVITPNIFNCQLWKTSGHWDHYKDNLIKFNLGQQDYSLKPMNCPGHCIMFKHQKMKYAHQLPIRWADFGALHRNEQSGAILGLSRVRRFQQDDAHIFCTPSQVESEVKGCLQFAEQIYNSFGFTFDVKLSLRPENYLGAKESWDHAEQSLRAALTSSNLKWEEQKFEGAFYGPKIDLVIRDCQNRAQQCATIQLDFQLPERFQLEYREADKTLQRPVIIHRAILGSIERFIAMISENCDGQWPFWLSPLQAQVIPIHPNLNDHAEQVCNQLRTEGFWADCDTRDTATLNAKIREAQLLPYSLILLLGQREIDTKSITCRINTKVDGKASISLASSSEKRGSVNNVNISIVRLLEFMKEFEARRVNRADLELLASNESIAAAC